MMSATIYTQSPDIKLDKPELKDDGELKCV
jgi:hypothetical protein